MKKLKKLPSFKDEAEERKFWLTHDSADYIDWSQAKRALFPHLKFSPETISIRFPKKSVDNL